eukprot:5129720-Heterocapsa_arctica.AAC.1
MASQRESGADPLCLAPAPSFATSPSRTSGLRYSPDEPCIMGSAGTWVAKSGSSRGEWGAAYLGGRGGAVIGAHPFGYTSRQSGPLFFVVFLLPGVFESVFDQTPRFPFLLKLNPRFAKVGSI